MFKQHFKERKNIQTVKIPHPKPQVKHPTFPFRQYHQCIDGGNPVLLVEVIEDLGFPFRSPGATDVWNEQEARFIHENQGPKAFGFFSYGAIGKPSNARFLSRFFVKPGVLVSGNSIPFPGGSSTHVGVIPDPKVLVNGLGNPLQGPKVCPIPCSQWT